MDGTAVAWVLASEFVEGGPVEIDSIWGVDAEALVV